MKGLKRPLLAEDESLSSLGWPSQANGSQQQQVQGKSNYFDMQDLAQRNSKTESAGTAPPPFIQAARGTTRGIDKHTRLKTTEWRILILPFLWAIAGSVIDLYDGIVNSSSVSGGNFMSLAFLRATMVVCFWRVQWHRSFTRITNSPLFIAMIGSSYFGGVCTLLAYLFITEPGYVGVQLPARATNLNNYKPNLVILVWAVSALPSGVPMWVWPGVKGVWIGGVSMGVTTFLGFAFWFGWGPAALLGFSSGFLSLALCVVIFTMPWRPVVGFVGTSALFYSFLIGGSIWSFVNSRDTAARLQEDQVWQAVVGTNLTLGFVLVKECVSLVFDVGLWAWLHWLAQQRLHVLASSLTQGLPVSQVEIPLISQATSGAAAQFRVLQEIAVGMIVCDSWLHITTMALFIGIKNATSGAIVLLSMASILQQTTFLGVLIVFLWCDWPSWARCKVYREAAYFLSSLNIRPAYLDSTHNRCLCTERQCYPSKKLGTTQPPVFWRGSTLRKFALPVGWCRFGVAIDPVKAKDLNIFRDWHVCFHGTTAEVLQSILLHQQLLLPGDTLLDGTALSIRDGHIKDQVYAYTSPSVVYAATDYYATPQVWLGRRVKIVLECRQHPDSVTVQGETIGHARAHPGELIDANFSNDEVEWYTNRRVAIVITGILIKVIE